MNENEVFNMYFGIIEDPRCEVNVIHPLIDILKLVMIGVRIDIWTHFMRECIINYVH